MNKTTTYIVGWGCEDANKWKCQISSTEILFSPYKPFLITGGILLKCAISPFFHLPNISLFSVRFYSVSITYQTYRAVSHSYWVLLPEVYSPTSCWAEAQIHYPNSPTLYQLSYTRGPYNLLDNIGKSTELPAWGRILNVDLSETLF